MCSIMFCGGVWYFLLVICFWMERKFAFVDIFIRDIYAEHIPTFDSCVQNFICKPLNVIKQF